MTYPPGFGGGPYPQRDPDRWGQEPEWVSWPEDAPKVAAPQVVSAEWAPLTGAPAVAVADAPEPQADRGRGPGRFVALGLAVLLLLTVGSAYFLFRENRSSAPEAASTTSEMATPVLPSTKPAPSKPGNRFSYTELGGDAWDFKFGVVELHADWVDGRDYDSCRDIERDAKLTALGCQYASELAYRTENGGLMLTQFILTMPDDTAAVAAQTKFNGKDLRLRPGSYIANYAAGKWKNEAKKNFVVVTVATSTDAVPEAVLDKYLRYLHTDTTLALMFR
ncbi:hypothetical protein [Nocardia sp. NPDC048505]|uniref:hypothetical protein n=1 Tax=unclassified Nocardia TaxID=2637762 RepID=UPI00340DF1DD